MRSAEVEAALKAVREAARLAGLKGIKVDAIVYEAAGGGIEGREAGNVVIHTPPG